MNRSLTIHTALVTLVTIITVLAGALFFVPNTSHAATDNPGTVEEGGGSGNGGNGGDADAGNAGGAAGGAPQTVNPVRTGTIALTSPIDCGGQACSVPVIIARVINFILSIVGAVAVIMLVYAGIVYMTSAGNTDRAASAKRTISYTVLGLVIVFLSLLIVNFTLRILGV